MTESVLDTGLVSELCEIMGDDFDGLVEAFVRDGEERLQALKGAAASESDPEQIRQMAHSFKGSSSNLGALEMTRLCLELEHQAGDQAQVQRLVAELESAFARACQALTELRAG